MTESQVASGAAAKSGSNEQGTYRLVIRAEIIPDTPVETVQPHSQKRLIGLIVGSVAAVLVLIWLGISVFNTESPATANEATRDVESPSPASPPLVSAPPQTPASTQPPTFAPAPSTGNSSAQSTSLAPAAGRDAPLSPLDEVIPDTPRSALNTIRGTVRVAIRVTIDQQGAVVAANTQERGPSRYFERLSREAARKWTFTPASTNEPRRMLLRFHFTREGVTARAEPVQ